jgi:hypothetical protein
MLEDEEEWVAPAGRGPGKHLGEVRPSPLGHLEENALVSVESRSARQTLAGDGLDRDPRQAGAGQERVELWIGPRVVRHQKPMSLPSGGQRLRHGTPTADPLGHRRVMRGRAGW